jgi:TPR repeat protein
LYEGVDVEDYSNCGEPDLDKSVKWYRLAAEQGDLYSMEGLAWLLDRGTEGYQSDKERFKWYKEAAIKSGDYSWTNHIVGLYYLIGLGTDANKIAAENWFRKGAISSIEELHRSSLESYSATSVDNPLPNYDFYAGVMHEFGLGTPLDKVEAKKWYAKALKGGYLPASKRIDSLTPIQTVYKNAVESAIDLNKGEKKYFGKWCIDEEDFSTDSVIVLMGKLIFTKSDSRYNVEKLVNYQETTGNLLGLTEGNIFRSIS